MYTQVHNLEYLYIRSDWIFFFKIQRYVWKCLCESPGSHSDCALFVYIGSMFAILVVWEGHANAKIDGINACLLRLKRTYSHLPLSKRKNKSWVRSWESHAQSHNYHVILKELNYIRKMIISYTGIFEMEGVCSHELFEFNLLIKSKAQYQEENLSNFCENTNIWYI